jgi:ethanolamine transporter EutH
MAPSLAQIHRDPWAGQLRGMLRTLMFILAFVAAASVLLRLVPATPGMVFLMAAVCAGPLFLVGKGLKFVDVAAVVVVASLTAAIMMPALQHGRTRAGGRKSFPASIPVKLHSLILPTS